MTEHITLTDEEWMSLIDGDRDGLPRCCANISALRDDVIYLARNGGQVDPFLKQSLEQHITWCFPEHDVPSAAMQKVIDALGAESQATNDPDVQAVVQEHYARRHKRLRYEFGGD